MTLFTIGCNRNGTAIAEWHAHLSVASADIGSMSGGFEFEALTSSFMSTSLDRVAAKSTWEMKATAE